MGTPQKKEFTNEELDLIRMAQTPEDLPEHLRQEWVDREMATSDIKGHYPS